MITLRDEGIKFFVNKLKNKEPFSFIRWGDGEWLMYFETGRGSAEYDFDKQGGKELRNCIDGDFYYGIQNMSLNSKRFPGKFPEREWFNADMFHYASMKGELKPLFDVLRENDIVLIGPKHLRKLDLPIKKFIEVPPRNCFKSKKRVKKEILSYQKPAVYIFCCAYLANILIYELQGVKDTMIDLGSLFDVFVEKPSRGYHRNMTKEIIEKNGYLPKG